MEVKNVSQLFYRLARYYLCHGYYYYQISVIPEGKNVSEIDEKIAKKYAIKLTYAERYKRKKNGVANVGYLRLERLIVLVATDGSGFEREKPFDFRKRSLVVEGYELRIRNNRALVTVERRRWGQIKQKIFQQRLRSTGTIIKLFKEISPYDFKGIQAQKFHLLVKINLARKGAGLERIGWDKISKPRTKKTNTKG